MSHFYSVSLVSISLISSVKTNSATTISPGTKVNSAGASVRTGCSGHIGTMPLFEMCCLQTTSSLREASSAPYIRAPDIESDIHMADKGLEPNESNLAPSNMDSSMKKTVRFNAGTTSSSTDLLNLIQFYRDSDDKETVDHWINIYEEHKNSIQQSSPTNLCKSKFESVDDLLNHSNNSSLSKDSKSSLPQYLVNRSMDRLPTGKENTGCLEKCRSADFPGHIQPVQQKLSRSKEMPNIADVSDDEASHNLIHYD
ncbi:hypothetical protein QR680_001289 [Steinernema hermaphroditum]|uniref:Uncharacterized protein n=1 Tax=Steinernema hermaphroditum TaxID=289476 RepID=A0AA39GXM8_9BILA|nr:hypothetical protein QR680_001289 [Steinernema hermaphroditum]